MLNTRRFYYKLIREHFNQFILIMVLKHKIYAN